MASVKPQLSVGNLKSGPGPKCRAIVLAATGVFLDHGYGAASMDAIAEKAGVSKQTVYSHFGSKEALFGAIIEDICDELLRGQTQPMPPLKPVDGDDLERRLMGMAERFLGTVLTGRAVALFRVVIAESGRFPELAESFYRAGPTAAIENMARLLRDLDQAGTLSVPDPVSSAKLFFALLRGDLYVRCLLGLASDPTPAERQAVVNEAVRTFIAAHAPAIP
ncbi:MAG: TetR/AcrR family transcriptional regulator [Rhodospirillales bacterium]|nr:TetR/AcrR family transcriptional regulator [Rhodospirillales bacterium]